MGQSALMSAPSPATGAPPRPYRWTVEAFYRALESGAFGLWPRVELIRGAVIEHESQTPLHAAITGHIAARLRAAVQARFPAWSQETFHIREHKPVQIAEDTEPDADITLIVGAIADYWERHPSPRDVALLVEVADSSTDYDLGEKSMLYAQAGINDYWVVLLNQNLIRVHRRPLSGRYAAVSDIGAGGTVTPPIFEDVTLAVRDLLGLTRREE